MSEEPLVVIDHVRKQYGTFVALEDLSLTVNRGRILGFIGPNGAGKTTTIKILVGHARPTSGTATVKGVNCTTQSDQIKRLVGYMPDEFGSYDNMRVSEYLDFFGAAFSIPRKQRRTRIDEVMEITGVTRMKDLFVESLSHGMKQRVGIARTLLHDPELIILDEPANGLDPRARIEMRQLLLDLAELGKTLIVTSHILPELARICDEVAIVSKGRLRAYGTVESILREVGQRRTWELLLTENSRIPDLGKLLQRALEEDASVELSSTEMTIRFQTTADDEQVQQLLKRVVSEEFPVVQMREVQLDLEDTFMSVTQDDASGAAT
ncbi:MAG: ABC transporter ATP-binding protein [Planctomycetaceae bacterium]